MLDTKSFSFHLLVVFASLALFPRLLCSSCCCSSLPSLIGEGFLLIWVAWKLTKWIRRMFFHETVPVENKAVFITGCDSGFGHRLAIRLNALGYTIFAACLDPSGAGAEKLKASVDNQRALHLIPLDVRSDEAVEAARVAVTDSLKKHKLKLWAIVNNAGVFSRAQVEWGRLADYKNLFEVNVFGVVRVTRAFLPLLRQSKGRVINVASIAGRIVGAGTGNYAMSKHAVVAFSSALRREMNPFGVKVSTIEPWIFKTPMADVGNLDRQADKEWMETEDSIKDVYGQEYFEKFRDLSKTEVERLGRDPVEVIDAMVDAITSLEPETAYRVAGILIGTLWTIQDFLPDSILDIFYNKVLSSRAVPKGAVRN